MNPRARRNIAKSHIQVDQHVLGGEALPFEDGRFDTVVSTWTLCSISAAQAAVAELYRVLRPGGRFVFLEHGLSEDASTQRWQRRLTPVQRFLADGCRLDLDVEGLVKSQPFTQVDLERFRIAEFPKTHGTMYRGVATK
jgi:SAM-dependent methyltransferase